jgi:hypothetical protein
MTMLWATPTALSIIGTSIDNNGIIVGDYIGADGVDHGYIGTIAE